jgi:uncharacterized protein with NRDE domain
MCTIAVLYRVHADAPLIVAANRDEFYARAARGPEVLLPDRRVVGGRDLASGGTWLGVRSDGALVAVTNQRTYAPPDPSRRSRGLAVLEALAAPDPAAAIAALDPTVYNGGNFVAGDARRVVAAYLRADAGTLEVEELTPGIHVLANDRLGSPDFPRTERLRALIEPHLGLPWPALAAHLHAALGDHQAPAVLPPRPPGRRLDPAVEAALERVCIHTPSYGTRWATVAALGTGHVVDYRVADGPPCTTPLRDATALVR